MVSQYAQIANLAAMTSQLNTLLNTWGDAEPWEVEVGAPYAGFVEFGTVHMSAQPYFRPAVEQVGTDVGRRVKAANSSDEVVSQLAKDIEREAQRLAPVDTGRLRDSIKASKA